MVNKAKRQSLKIKACFARTMDLYSDEYLANTYARMIYANKHWLPYVLEF
jgi:hypothetical protein